VPQWFWQHTEKGDATLMMLEKHYQQSRPGVVQYFRTHRFARLIGGYVVLMSVIAVALLGATLGKSFASPAVTNPCASGDATYTVAAGDSLSGIALRYQTTWQELADHNHLGQPNLILTNQQLCIPGQASTVQTESTDIQSAQPEYALAVAVGRSNPYPYAQCTWWANQRYHQRHGAFVPWTTNSNAWQWPTRARQYGWKVSSKPSVGSIIVLQPWVQGAYGLGHVAYVERVLSNGRVIASNMNWAGNGSRVVNSQFHAGPGVSFISR
jgi:surface antigen